MTNLPTVKEIAKTIDHALLKPTLTLEEVKEGLELAKKYDVFSVCVRPADIPFAVEFLKNTDVKVGTVIGFPHGVSHTQTKKFETMQAAMDGAHEIDMVLNISWVKSGHYDKVVKEIKEVTETARLNGIRIIKVILETAYLTSDEIKAAAKCVEEGGASFVKTSTGFAGEGATLPNLKIMRESVSDEVEVKASGGVTNLDALIEMRKVGVTRFGTSATQSILDELEHRLQTGEHRESTYTESY